MYDNLLSGASWITLAIEGHRADDEIELVIMTES